MFYPGSGIRRAIFTETPTVAAPAPSLTNPVDIDAAISQIAAHIAINPFVDEHPVCIAGQVVVTDDHARVIDTNGNALSLVSDYEPWNLLALIGAQPVPLFGEVTEERFRPLAVELDGELVAV